MKHSVIAVKDLAAQTFGQPFFAKHPNEAIRSFSDEVNRQPVADPNTGLTAINNLYSHSHDFELYELGFFDDRTGFLICHENGPVLVAQAKHLARHDSGPATPTMHLNGGTDTKSVVM